MTHNLQYYPPVGTPDAIRSARGWLHPVTKELLVSVQILDVPQIIAVEAVVTSTAPNVKPAKISRN